MIWIAGIIGFILGGVAVAFWFNNRYHLKKKVTDFINKG